MKDKGKLGGARAATNMSEEERRARAAAGGMAIKNSRPREYYVRLAMRRWGKKVELSGPWDKAKSVTAKTTRAGADPGKGEESNE